MSKTHFSGPVYSTGGFVGDLTGSVSLPTGISATTLAVSTTSAFTGVATFTAQPILSSLTASSAVATDASKGLVSVTNTGTGNNVLAASPTITGSAKITNPITPHTPTVVNATTTLTGAQASTGYLSVTSTSAVALTMPTGTDLGTVLGAVQGTTYDLFIDNTASSSSGVVTMIANTNAIVSALAAAESGGSGLLTVPVGVTGQAWFKLMFSSATAYTFTRVG